MGKMLVVVDFEDKVPALQSQLEDAPELFVLSAPPLKVSLKPCAPGQHCDKGKFSFSFSTLESGKPFMEKLRQYAGGDVYLAFDRDQRGEFMSWLVAKAMAIISPGAPPPRRLHLLALHDAELRESFRHVEPIHDDWAINYHDRAVFDVALGKHIQRLLGTRTGPAGVPLSTFCLTTLLLLAEREAEIRAHAQRPKQRLRVKLAAGGTVFTVFLAYAFGVSDDGDLYGVKDVEAALRLLRDVQFVVDKVKKTELVLDPPSPYRLVDLLEDAFVVHKIPLAKTMEAARRLFAGVDVDGGCTGLVSTYAAVDIPTSATVAEIRREVERLSGREALLPEGSVATGEGFLLPTRPDLDAARLAGILDPAEAQIYGMIRNRALASQMRPAEGDAVVVEIKAGEHCYFKAMENDIAEPGHLAVFHGVRDRNPLEPSPLAGLQEGDTLRVEQVVPEPAKSGLARFYTLESLFAELADFSVEIGPVAVDVLHLLVEGDYVEILPSGELRCRGNANKVTSTLDRAFPTMRGVNFSAYLEQTVQEVLSGRKALDVALRQFDQTMIMKGNVLQKISVSAQMQARLRMRKPQGVIKGGGAVASQPRPPVAPPAASVPPPTPAVVAAEEERVVGKEAGRVADAPPARLPDQEAVAVERVAGMPEEAAAEVSVAQVPEGGEEHGVGQPLAEASPVAVEPVEKTLQDTEIVSSVELALDGLDEPVATQPAPATEEAARQAVEVFEAAAEASLAEAAEPAPLPEASAIPDAKGGEDGGMACPVCRKGHVMQKITPTGKPFYVCRREECEFMAWAKPHAVPCQVCGSPFLVEKKNLRGYLFLSCPKAGCNFRRPLPGDDGMDLLAEEQAEDGTKKRKILVRRVAKGAPASGKTRKVLVRRRK
ncbi:MAG: DNA topoisomerase [Desulfobulbaceae bacterium]|nr:DNA topoisomerase [Desulfobulbaceae bacterium]